LATSISQILTKFRIVTKAVQEQGPTLNQVMFQVTLVKEELEAALNDGAYGVQTFAESLLSSLQKRVIDPYFHQKELLVASFLCPNIKGIILSDEQQISVNKHVLEFLEASFNKSSPSAPSNTARASTTDNASSNKMVQKLLALRATKAVDIPQADPNVHSTKMMAQNELNAWESIPASSTGETNVLQFWADQQALPHLKKLAQKVFSRPTSSAESERLFSKAGLIYCDTRSKLSPHHAEMLIVIDKALRANNFLLKYN
jgi:hypothetical protein